MKKASHSSLHCVNASHRTQKQSHLDGFRHARNSFFACIVRMGNARKILPRFVCDTFFPSDDDSFYGPGKYIFPRRLIYIFVGRYSILCSFFCVYSHHEPTIYGTDRVIKTSDERNDINCLHTKNNRKSIRSTILIIFAKMLSCCFRFSRGTNKLTHFYFIRIRFSRANFPHYSNRNAVDKMPNVFAINLFYF